MTRRVSRRPLTRVLSSLALTGLLLVASAPARTVIGPPPAAPSAVEELSHLRGEVRLAYYTYCLTDQPSARNPVLANVCGTLDLVAESLRTEEERLCREAPAQECHGAIEQDAR